MADVLSGPDSSPPSPPSLDVQSVKKELQKVLTSGEFAGSRRLCAFLEFVVLETLEGRAQQLKEVVVGIEILAKPSFDPRSDGTVRIVANRVRKKLDAYYRGSGKTDPVHIRIPTGHYVPEFVLQSEIEKGIVEAAKEPRRTPLMKYLRAVLGVAALVVGIAVLVWYSRRTPIDPPLPQIHWGRILAKYTSEGSHPPIVRLSYQPDYIAASFDERKVYVSSGSSRFLTAISTIDNASKNRTLPQDAGPLSIGAGSEIYVGSRLGGIMVVDVQNESRAPKVVETPGPVWDLALTTDGTKLFAAMGGKGVWRFLTKDWTARRLTDQGCPEHLEIGGGGRTLVVVYQCGGPGGGNGHDSVDLFDTQTEKLVASVALTGKPFVGGAASFSPDGQSILLDGEDACSSGEYQNEDCPAPPSHVFHFIRLQDLQIVKSLGMPTKTASARFIDPGRVLVFGESLGIVNTSLYTMTENWQSNRASGERPDAFEAVVFLPRLRRAYVADRERSEIAILDAEDADCATLVKGLVASYSGDGVFSDVVGESSLSAVGGVQFAPGRVGQAFAFDGVSGHLVASPSGHYHFGYYDSSFAGYVKFESAKGAMTIIDRRSQRGTISARLSKTADNHLAFQFATKERGDIHLQARSELLADRWYQVVVTKDSSGLAMYLNGAFEDHVSSTSEAPAELSPLYFGSTWDEKAFLRGKLDEIIFYDRALTAKEVHDLYEKRESGACRM